MGEPVSALPTFAPSNWNCTLEIPALLVALAVATTVPNTFAPLAGAVIDTTGPLTALFTVTKSPALVVLFPAVSLATATSVCAPFELFVVTRE